MLSVYPGYAWDGASGPTIDTPAAIRASLVHDVLYQLIEIHALPWELRTQADKEFRAILLADGMSPWRVRYWYWSVHLFGGQAIRRSRRRRSHPPILSPGGDAP